MPEKAGVRKARAIIIKEKNNGESNKQLTLLVKDEGKLIVSAKGARNQKSKFLAGARLFCYCDFMLYDGGGFLAVTQIDLIKCFSERFDDIYKMMYGSYFLELIDKSVMFSQEANDVMLLLLKALYMLEKTDNPKKISATFTIKLLELLGFLPEADVCTECGGRIRGETFFSPSGFLCKSCKDGEVVPEGVLEAFAYIKNAKDFNKAFLFMLPEPQLESLSVFAEALSRNRLEVESSCLGIIKKL